MGVYNNFGDTCSISKNLLNEAMFKMSSKP